MTRKGRGRKGCGYDPDPDPDPDPGPNNNRDLILGDVDDGSERDCGGGAQSTG